MHTEAEGIKQDPGFRETEKLEDWEAEIEDLLEEHIHYMKERYDEPIVPTIDQKEENWYEKLPDPRNQDCVSRAELMEYVEQVHNTFEDIFEYKVHPEDWGKVQETHIYDESLGYKLKETIKQEEFADSLSKGVILSGAAGLANGIAGFAATDLVYEATGNYEQAMEVSNQVLSYMPASLAVPVTAGALYGAWKSWGKISDAFDGRYHRPDTGLGPKILGETEERRIAINSGQLNPIDALGIAISENTHLFQDYTDSPAYDEFLLIEGMDLTTNFAVMNKDLNVPKLTEEDIKEDKDSFKLDWLSNAYASLKNKGAEEIDPMTFTSVGLDPETSQRLSRNVEKMFEEDMSDQHFYSGSIGGSLITLAMEKHGEEVLGDILQGDISNVPHIRKAEQLDFLQKTIEESRYQTIEEMEEFD